MPDFKFELPDDTPLFDEPFTLTLPGVGTFNLVHRGNPPDEEDVNPETKPLSYFRALLVEQVVEEEREAFAEALTAALNAEPPQLDIAALATAYGWISEQRQKAEREKVKETTKRPTGARSRSRAS